MCIASSSGIIYLYMQSRNCTCRPSYVTDVRFNPEVQSYFARKKTIDRHWIAYVDAHALPNVNPFNWPRATTRKLLYTKLCNFESLNVVANHMLIAFHHLSIIIFFIFYLFVFFSSKTKTVLAKIICIF